MKTQSKRSTPHQIATRLSVPKFPRTLPFSAGYVQKVWCRGTNFRHDAEGTILCILHSADGAINARISRPDVDLHALQDWQLLLVDVVTIALDGVLTAEVMRVHTALPMSGAFLDLMPRAVCALPSQLDEFRHLAQFIQAPELRRVVEIVFSDTAIYLPFLSRFAGSECYAYPSGLLARTVDAAKQALGMGFQTQEEADLVLTAAFLYDLGRLRDGNLMSESLRNAIGFVPHSKTWEVVSFAINVARYHTHAALAQVLRTGFCDRYTSLHSDRRQQSALAKIDAVLRRSSKMMLR